MFRYETRETEKNKEIELPYDENDDEKMFDDLMEGSKKSDTS